MKFASVCPLMFLAAASALELPSTFNYANMFESSRFHNRFNWRTRAVASNIVDRNGWVTGTPATFVATQSNWFGGCRFKPAKMFEEYMNNYTINAGSGLTPPHVPDFQNKRLSGIATYRCADTAPSGEGGTTQCNISARIRGFKWDEVAQAGTVVAGATRAVGQTILNLYHPIVYTLAGMDAGSRITSADYEMTDYCTIRDVDVNGTPTVAGTVDELAINRFAGDTGVVATLTVPTATYRYSNFATDEVASAATQDQTTANWEGAAQNTSWKNASVYLSYHTTVDAGAFNTVGVTADAPGQPELEALLAHAKIPNIACCKLEQWPKRTHMRYKKSIADFITRICADGTKTNLSCQAGAPL